MNPILPFFSFLPSTCLTSLTSHLPLYDLIFVHHFMSFVHHYREKDDSNSSLLVKQLRQNPFHPFSSFLPSTCLTSLTSHLHLYDLIFVHHFINIAGLLYVIRALTLKNSNVILFYNSKKSLYHYIILFYNIFTSQTSTSFFYLLK